MHLRSEVKEMKKRLIVESSSLCGMYPNASNEESSRRRFLQMTIGATVTGLVTVADMEFVTLHSTLAQTSLSPDAALQELRDGNKCFADERPTAYDLDLPILK